MAMRNWIKTLLVLHLLAQLWVTPTRVLAREQGEISKLRLLPCFKPDERLGYRPKSNCRATARAPWSGPIEYQFNSLGLIEKEIKTPPESGKLRVLLLGPQLEVVGMTEDQRPARVLERRLAQLELPDVEVINGVIPGYFAPRYAMIASEMAKAIEPDIVIYYQSGDNFAFDFLEEQRIQRNQFDDRVKYDGPGHDEFGYLERWQETIFRFGQFWNLYWETRREVGERPKLSEAGFAALEEIASRFGPKTKFIYAWAPRPASNNNVIFGLGPVINFLVQALVPSVEVQGPVLTRVLRGMGAVFIPVSRELAFPVRNGLAPPGNPYVLTPRGVEEWVDGLVNGLKREILTLGVDSTSSRHIGDYRARQKKRERERERDPKAKSSSR